MKKISFRLNEINNYLNNKQIFKIPLDDLLVKLVLALLLIGIIVTMMPSERPFEYSNLTVGSISREEIIAPFTYPIIKSEDVLENQRQQARLSVAPVFDYQAQPASVQKIKLKNLFDELVKYFDHVAKKDISGSKKNEYQTTGIKPDSVMQQLQVKYNINFTSENITALFQLYQANRLAAFHRSLAEALWSIYEQGILEIPKSEIEESQVAVIRDGLERKMSLTDVLGFNQAENQLSQVFAKNDSLNATELSLAKVLWSAFLKPNLIFNREITASRKEKAVHEVPTTSGFVHKDQRIVDSHEIITEDIYQKLQSLAEALKERSTIQGGWHHLLFYLGKYLFAFITTILLGLYLFYYRPQIFKDNKMLVLVTVVLLLQFLFAILILNGLGWNYQSIPITLAPMLLSMLLDASVAFIGTVIVSIILGATYGNNFYLMLLVLVVGSIALFSVQKIRNRGQMFRAIFYILLGYAILTFSNGFIHYEPFKTMFQDFFYYQVPNAILVPTAVFLLIGIFERFFDVTTDITLLELSDLNHPLLKQLSVQAPGTFHHSIIVGNLAEAAAKAIGANSLLARVGCYYHDIGKMQRAEYFVENQAGAMNKHEKLTPSMSSLILSKHVKAGLELAEKYNLPRAVKQFIPEHHGTNLMSYFYHKAKETMDEKDINEDDFRYPGPRPQSKETAIAMLADAVEAAARTLPNPNLQRLRNMVENLIEQRFQEGELDDCDLTLRELNNIKEAFMPVLIGIHHIRVEYPSSEPKDEKYKQPTAKKTETESKPLASKNVGKKMKAQNSARERSAVAKQPVTANEKNNNK